MSRTFRVKETMVSDTALFSLPTPRLEHSASEALIVPHTFSQSPRFGRRPFPSENKQPADHTVKDGSMEVTHLRTTELETLASQADA